MYECIELKNNDDYFLDSKNRQLNSVYFVRYIGFDDALIPFLQKYYDETIKHGVFIQSSPLTNPDINQVKDFTKSAMSDGVFDISHVSKDISIYLPMLNQNQKVLLTDSIIEVLETMSKKNMNQNILKNAYIKFMCWTKHFFLDAIKLVGKTDVFPKILYNGAIGKYDIFMLKILSRCGCDILYYNIDDTSYLQYDDKNLFSKPIYSDRKEPLPVISTKKSSTSMGDNLSDTASKESTKEPSNNITIPTSSMKIDTNIWIDSSNDLFDLLFKSNNIRSVGSEILATNINNIFAAYIGIDEKEEYNNRLCDLKDKFEKENKPYVIVENSIMNPMPDEVAKLIRFQPTTKEVTLQKLTSQIDITNNKKINSVFQFSFYNYLNSLEMPSLTRLYNEGNKLLCWLNRYIVNLYKSFDENKLPCVIYFGECNKHEASFLNMLSTMPLDVLYIEPHKKDTLLLKDNCLKVELKNSSNDFDKFPTSKLRVRVATTAYNAERELDTILYEGTGLYREHQFLYSKPVTLKTTFEEIELLWKEEAKFRPAFCVHENNDVILPNIFAKVCGLKNDDVSQYVRYVRSLIDENTITINHFPYISDCDTRLTSVVRGFHEKNGTLLVDLIKKHPSYKYDYLTDNIQDYIFEKIQELITLNWISTNNEKNPVDIILETLLNLDKKTLQLIQQFDFTKKVPKVVLLSVNENMFSIKDCIYICFLNLVGFDIIIFTPTGYKNIEKYVDSNIFENYTIGNFKYDIEPFELKYQSNVSSSIFTKFFKGR